MWPKSETLHWRCVNQEALPALSGQPLIQELLTMMRIAKSTRRYSTGSRVSHRVYHFRRGNGFRPTLLVIFKILVIFVCPLTARTMLNAGNPDAKRLYDDLLSNYNKLVRPVVNTTDPLTVRIKLKLSQLIDVVSFTKRSKCFLWLCYDVLMLMWKTSVSSIPWKEVLREQVGFKSVLLIHQILKVHRKRDIVKKQQHSFSSSIHKNKFEKIDFPRSRLDFFSLSSLENSNFWIFETSIKNWGINSSV